MPILQWLNKDEAVITAKKSTYRLLKEEPELSYGDSDTENMLIQGDNLEALKALIPYYAGQVKCIYIDPPYNTGKAFEQYDDNLEHSIWLSTIYPRIELLRELLSEDGFILINLDKNQHAYAKVIMDEVYGRNNFVGDFIWKKRKGGGNDSTFFAIDHDYILVYAKNKELKKHKSKYRVSYDEAYLKRYKEIDEHGERYYWDTLARDGLQNPICVEVPAPDGSIVKFNSQKSIETILKGLENGTIRIKKGKKGWTVHHRVYMPKAGKVLRSIVSDYGTNKTANDHQCLLFEDAFDTPKPEELIMAFFDLFTNEKDIVLDSFLGSGTTAAVAHKMNRKYMGVEIGEHAKTHCQNRLKQVIDGEQGGISETVNWKGGGGFKFYELGEAVFNEYGSLNHEIKFPTLAAHIWFLETKTPIQIKDPSPFLGIHNGTAYYLLYNGILGDRRPQGGNVLHGKVLNELPDISEHEKVVIYGESSRLGEARLKQHNITFKQIPYDVGSI